MQTLNPCTLSLFVLSGLALASGSIRADQVVTTLPGGDGKEILANPKNPSDSRPGDPAGGALVVDNSCKKKPSNAEYEKCVKDKLEKAKKKSDH